MKDRIQYGYDRAGNRTWRKNLVAPENQDQHYLYDPLYQVTEAARGNLNLNQTAIGSIPPQRQTFAYDPSGNWDRYTTAENGVDALDQTRIHNQANQITQIGGSNAGLLYDRAGNATQMPPNAAGDWGQHCQLTWDAWNRLVKVEDQDDEVVASYAYDGTTRQTAKTTEEGVMHTYYNEKWKAVEERVGSSEDPHLQYLWGARPNHRDELVRRNRDADDSGSLEEKLYCLMDYFDPTSVTDEEGNVQERYQFSAFGLRSLTDAEWTPQSESEFGFTFGFHGQMLDSETAYYNYGYRSYNPSIGKWMSRDPIKEAGGENLYNFCNNSCPNTNDLFGADVVDSRARQRSIEAANLTRQEEGVWEHRVLIRPGEDLPLSFEVGRREYCGIVCRECDGDNNVSNDHIRSTNPHAGPNKVLKTFVDDNGYLNWKVEAECYPFLILPSNTTESCTMFGPRFRLAAIYHSHPDDSPFSPADIELARTYRVPIYLGLPSGGVFKFDPQTDKEDQL